MYENSTYNRAGNAVEKVSVIILLPWRKIITRRILNNHSGFVINDDLVKTTYDYKYFLSPVIKLTSSKEDDIRHRTIRRFLNGVFPGLFRGFEQKYDLIRVPESEVYIDGSLFMLEFYENVEFGSRVTDGSDVVILDLGIIEKLLPLQHIPKFITYGDSKLNGVHEIANLVRYKQDSALVHYH